MAKPTENPVDPDMLAGMEGLIVAMKDRRPAAAAEASGLESVPTRESDGGLAAAPWHAIGASPRASSEDAADVEQDDALAQGTVIDRYVVLKRLGAGGMGVVYAAYDPELDRKVALKLLRADVSDEQARARLLREAQALGKLAHPNIVAVHDVGTVDEQVWLAMEFVQGSTLREWLRRRPDWREALRVMRSAGKGLAAAHAAGLLHRDFKPDNVMISDDSRVRVMDFGLARMDPGGVPSEAGSSEQPAVETLAMQLTAAGAVVGTPVYMAPEQLESRELTAAADQFAFCVSLWEALYGERPFGGRTLRELVVNVLGGRRRTPPKDRAVPSRLRRACERGLALDPRQRWPSMEALLVELRRIAAPGRRWLALGLAGGLATLGGGLALAQYVEVMDRCTGARAELDGIWDETKRQEVQASILGTELTYAPGTWERVERRLDAHAEAWANKHTEVCEATRVTEAQTEAVMELRMGCLREHRTAMRAAVDVLGQADSGVVEKAVELLAGLPRVERCDDVELLEQQRERVPPPEDPEVAQEVEALRDRLADIAAAEVAGKHSQELGQIDSLMQQVYALRYAPLLAEAKLRRGRLLMDGGRYTEAEQDLRAAYTLSLVEEHDTVTLVSARALAFVVGEQQTRHAEGLVWAQTALPLAERLGDLSEQAASLSTQGAILEHQGDYEQAKLHHQQAVEIAARVDDLVLAHCLNNLGNTFQFLGDHEQAQHHYQRALEILEEALGSAHPHVAMGLGNLGTMAYIQGDLEQAKRYHLRALEIFEAALGADHPLVAKGLNQLGNVLFDQGDYEQSEIILRRALQISERSLGTDHYDVSAISTNLGGIAYSRGDYEQAELLFRRALQISENALDATHPTVATNLNNLGNLFLDQGDYEQAKAIFQRAVRIYVKALGPDHPVLAATLTNLGLVAHGQGDYQQAEIHFRRAMQIYEKALGPQHAHVAYPLIGLAKLALVVRRHDLARVHAERALSLREAGNVAGDELAEARFVLARTLWTERAERARAQALAEQAREAFAQHGKGREVALAEAKAWLAEHTGASSQAH